MELVDAILASDDPVAADKLRDLASGGTVRVSRDKWVTADDPLDRPRTVYSLMVAKGHLRAEGDRHVQTLSIPNMSRKGEFEDEIEHGSRSDGHPQPTILSYNRIFATMMNVPIGIQSFQEVRKLDAYYIDKTPLIDRILSDPFTKVFLYTRPRRFGKSLNLSTLEAYLNFRYTGNGWFDGLKVSDLRPDDSEKNAYPVIFLDFKMLSTDSYEIFVDKARIMISNACKSFPELASSQKQDEDDRDIFRQLKSQTSNVSNLTESVATLCRMLEVEYGRKTVVLIDEYDSPVNRAYGKGYQEAITTFVRDMLSSALKGNPSLRLAVVTGVMQIAKESIFSGLNNLWTCNIFSKDMDEMFGFTSDEVEILCKDFGHPEKFEEARYWYDGYCFGNADIYNPWSVLSYVKNGFVPKSYWAGTSGNSIIDDLLSYPAPEIFEDIMTLGSGKTVCTSVNEAVTFNDISDLSGGIYSVMVMSGYLRAEPDRSGYALSIPNREMFVVFANMITSRLGASVNKTVMDLARATLKGDAAGVGKALEDLLKESIGSRILTDERPYEAFISGLLMALLGNYEVTADFESGEGYHDIRLKRVRGGGANVIIEVKHAKGEATPERMDALAREALKQIQDRDYAHGMTGKVLSYGVVFDGKVPTIVIDEETR